VLKVLLIVPDLHWSAGGDTAVLLARGLRARQCDVRLATFRPIPPEHTSLAEESIAIHVLEASTARDPRRLLQFWRELRRFQPDVVHTLQPLGNILGRLTALVSSEAALFVSAHIAADDAWHGQRWLYRLGHRRPGRWLVPAPALGERWRVLGIPAEKIAVVPLGVEIAPVRAANMPLRERFGLPADVPVICCPAPLLRRKGGREAVWALDILRFMGIDARLVLAGFGPEFESVEGFARAIDIRERVRFFQRKAALGDVLAVADVVWIPSLGADEPELLLAALLAGKPVVASRVPGLAEFICDGETGLLSPPGDKPGLVRQTCRLLEDAALRAQLAGNARQAMKQDHTADAFVDRVLELYRHA
jgi:glycosyltransferase involved in cell wall biosynthesis